METKTRMGRSTFGFVAITVLLVTLILAAQCGAPATAPPPEATEAPAAAEEEAAPAEKPYADTTITVLMDDRTQSHKLRDMLPEFEEATGIKVDIDIMPEGALVEKENLELSQGVGTYDVMQYIWLFNISWAKNGWLTDMSPFIEDPSMTMFGFDVDNYDEPIWDLCTREGEIVGVNLIGSTGYMFYNKELLDKAGVAVPTNMEEFFAAAEACTNPDEGVYGFAGRGERGGTQNFLNWMEFVKAYDGRIFDEDWNVVLDPEGIEGTEQFVKAMREYAPEGALTAGWTEVQTMFQQGQVCMIWETNDMLSRLNDPSQSKVVGNVGTAVLPAAKEKNNAFLASWAMGIPSTSENKEAAWMFVQWATSTDIGIRAGYASTKEAIKTQYEAYPNPEGEPAIGDVIAEGFSYADPDFFPRVPEYFEWSEALAVEVSNALTDQKTSEQAIKDAAKTVEDVMTKAGYY